MADEPCARVLKTGFAEDATVDMLALDWETLAEVEALLGHDGHATPALAPAVDAIIAAAEAELDG